jgi:hypothetical protein
MPNLSKSESPVYPQSLAVHINARLIVLTVDVRRGLLAGRQYAVGNQVISSVPNERAMLKRANWAARAVEIVS